MRLWKGGHKRPRDLHEVRQTPRIRVAHLVSHPIQYFAPLYRELAKRPEIELTVFFFYSDATSRPFYDAEFGRTIAWDVPLLQGYRWKVLPSAVQASPPKGFLSRPNWDIVRHVIALAATRSSGTRLLPSNDVALLEQEDEHSARRTTPSS